MIQENVHECTKICYYYLFASLGTEGHAQEAEPVRGVYL